MDKISDFIKDLRDRVSNPFIGSFIISWLLVNWKAPIAWIFYDNASMKAFRNTDHIGFLLANVTILSGLLLPFAGACFYTFVWPKVRAYIKEYHTKINIKSGDKIINISKESSVKMSRYFKLLGELKDRETRLTEVFMKDEELSLIIQQKDNKIEELQRNLNTYSTRIEKIEKLSKKEFIFGRWQVNIIPAGNSATINTTIKFNRQDVDEILEAYSYNVIDNKIILAFKGDPFNIGGILLPDSIHKLEVLDSDGQIKLIGHDDQGHVFEYIKSEHDRLANLKKTQGIPT